MNRPVEEPSHGGAADAGEPAQKLAPGEWILAALFGAVIVIAAAQVVFRYVLNNSLTWSEELSRYLFTWIIFLGAALAVKDGSHIAVEVILNRFPARFARWIRIGHQILILAFLVFIIVLGARLVGQTANTISPALSLPVNYVFYAALPVTATVGACYALRNIIVLAPGKGGRAAQKDS